MFRIGVGTAQRTQQGGEGKGSSYGARSGDDEGRRGGTGVPRWGPSGGPASWRAREHKTFPRHQEEEEIQDFKQASGCSVEGLHGASPASRRARALGLFVHNRGLGVYKRRRRWSSGWVKENGSGAVCRVRRQGTLPGLKKDGTENIAQDNWARGGRGRRGVPMGGTRLRGRSQVPSGPGRLGELPRSEHKAWTFLY